MADTAGADPTLQLDAWRTRIDAALERALDLVTGAEPRLVAGMRHAVLLGGKRMRPLLAHASGHACGADPDALDGPATAIELIHAYSLVHDDLPAMDDDALRRGQPTVHMAFDEGTAILVGDALQALAFQVLADTPVSDDRRVSLLRELAMAAGAHGMCGGQALDLAATGKGSNASLQNLEQLHALKTGALIRAAVRMGALAAGAGSDQHKHLDSFADALGLAFQIRDDLLDVEGESETLGKTAGKDAAQDKATFPALIGIEASRARLAELADTMSAALAPLGPRTDALRALAELAIHRSH
ncbi:polyprenyl synthetase family protein [Luteimonas qiangzhengi]|uniref:polyprenyl synthetase family protein n=1 Tax=Luteimonas sp. MJ146 TaxID=3129240 RepID=UPI0031BB5B05